MTRLYRALSDAIAALRRDPRCTRCGRPITDDQGAEAFTSGRRWTYTHLTAADCKGGTR